MTDLTDRMRTCAAFIIASEAHEYDDEIGRVLCDAADLLVEASNALESHQPHPGLVDALGAPMEIIPPVVPQAAAAPAQNDLWIAPGEPLPGLKRSGTVSIRACPNCGSRATKSVHRVEKRMMLECPMCAHQWAYK